MYKILGGDRKEYGPVSVEEITRWLAEGRLNAQSLAQAEGSAEWKPLSAFPEFAVVLGSQSGGGGAGAVPPPINPAVWVEGILAVQPQVNIGRCLSRSWTLLAGNFGLIMGATLVVWLIGTVQFVPLLGLFYKILWGALFGGFYLLFLKRIRGQAAGIGDVFSGFTLAFGQLVLAGFISSLLAGIGTLFCVIPGIYLLVAWAFSVPLAADKRLEFWPAMELSRKTVTRVWFQMFGLLLVAFLPSILASLFATGKLVTVVFGAIHHAMMSGQPNPQSLMEDLMPLSRVGMVWGFMVRLVLLVNLPFATGALMFAYEDIFGTRPAPKA